MKKTYCRWKEAEIKSLFDFIEQTTSNGLPLTKAFSQYATKSGRKSNSVRNYYYAELNFLQNNQGYAEKLGINLNRHQKVTPQYFSDKEAQKCVEDIDNLVKQGNSVRKACLILSKGDISQMVRLQNKYRSLTKETRNNKNTPTNVISMPQRNKHLNQHEIDSLFLGLLKLIKASAKQEAIQSFNKTTDTANQELRKTLVVLAEKEKQLRKMQASFEILQQENTKAKEVIKKLRSEQVQKTAHGNEKMKKLKKYSTTIKTQENNNIVNHK